MRRHGCPKSLEWISSCSASETTFGCEEYEHNNECRAIGVIGQDWSSEVVALFVGDLELGRVALSCQMTMDLLCQEMSDACWDCSESLGLSQQKKAFLSLWSAVTVKERNVVREKKKRSVSDRLKFSKGDRE